jgi:HPt (histidine-containing phosphotransfer) domain-containing protein
LRGCWRLAPKTSGGLRGDSIDPDRTIIEREADSLKSAAAAFGYRELASLALRLEREAARIADGEYRRLLDRMDAAYSAAAAQELQH